MPRLPPSFLRLANTESHFLPPLLRECWDLPSSRNELRWLTEHAISQSQRLRSKPATTPAPRSKPIPGWRTLLKRYVQRRERGEPLQYILGTQPFCELEILCKPGVLVPRWETEVYTSNIGCFAREFFIGGGEKDGIRELGRTLRILDLCTGTGCIPLALCEMLGGWESGGRGGCDGEKGVGRFKLEVLGVDISNRALDLARENLRHNISKGYLPKEAVEEMTFLRADVLRSPHPGEGPRSAAPYVLDVLKEAQCKDKDKPKLEIDILTANPPYISPTHFSSGRTTRSVRKYEPRLALVPLPSTSTQIPGEWSAVGPTTPGDEFYHHILPLSKYLNAGLTVLEVGGTEQAERVIELARGVLMKEEVQAGDTAKQLILLELWFDDGGTEAGGTTKSIDLSSAEVEEEQEVSVRAVVIWRREWAAWRRRQLGVGRKTAPQSGR